MAKNDIRSDTHVLLHEKINIVIITCVQLYFMFFLLSFSLIHSILPQPFAALSVSFE